MNNMSVSGDVAEAATKEDNIVTTVFLPSAFLRACPEA